MEQRHTEREKGQRARESEAAGAESFLELKRANIEMKGKERRAEKQ